MSFEQQFLHDVRAEEQRAAAVNTPMHGYHEAYAIILEELDEFWDIVRLKAAQRDAQEARMELIQVAAMCMRAAKDLGLDPVENTL